MRSISANAKILLRRDTAANWANPLKNPILGDGEQGYETDTGKMKIGNGITRWNQLPYQATGPTGPQGPPGTSSSGILDGGAPDTVFVTGDPGIDCGGVT